MVILLSASLAMAGAWAALHFGKRLHAWPARRDLQLLALGAPLVSLAVAIVGAHHFAEQICFLGAPPADYLLSLALPSAMALLAGGAIALGIIRLVAMRMTWGATGHRASFEFKTMGELETMANGLAERLGLVAPRIVVCDDDRPVALALGIFKPTLLVSRWMLERLDRAELEGVLAHELAHVARRDFLVAWLATVLRDAFVYLPTSWVAHHQLQEEKELACDDLAVRLTGRPLALASALATVQLHSSPFPSLGAQALAATPTQVETRIERLLAPHPRQT